jgi:glucose/arabinose dehydrogenase
MSSGTGGTSTGTGGSSNTGGTPGSGGTGNLPRVNTCDGQGPKVENSGLPAGYCASVFATGVDEARGILWDGAGNLLVIQRSTYDVIALWDADGDGQSGEGERAKIANADGLNHGIALHGGVLYASNDSTLYGWTYTANRKPLGEPRVVVRNVPAAGGHRTRTPAFDAQGNLYLSVGSGGNLDQDSTRARIKRFTAAQVKAGVDWADGEIFADGLRNEVGLRFDAQGRLWGVENERDNLSRDDLGATKEDNPAEELNLFKDAGKFYGYPYCWSEGKLPAGKGKGPGTQWRDPNAPEDKTDGWCQNPSNVTPPALAMQAHSAPLDLIFYTGGSFPNDVVGDVFVAFHGSWNREVPTGRSVVRIPIGDNGLPSGPAEPFLKQSDGKWEHRPVALAIGARGELYVSSDSTGTIFVIGHDGS